MHWPKCMDWDGVYSCKAFVALRLLHSSCCIHVLCVARKLGFSSAIWFSTAEVSQHTCAKQIRLLSLVCVDVVRCSNWQSAWLRWAGEMLVGPDSSCRPRNEEGPIEPSILCRCSAAVSLGSGVHQWPLCTVRSWSHCVHCSCGPRRVRCVLCMDGRRAVPLGVKCADGSQEGCKQYPQNSAGI